MASLKRKGENVDATDVAAEFGRVVVKVGDREVIIPEDGEVKLVTPVKEQSNGAPAIVRASSLGSGAYNPANALIPVGVVQLNKTDEYLRYLPDSAMAEYLIAPRSTAEIFRDGPRDLAPWLTDIAAIRSLGENHGFHAYGELVKGMQAFDHFEDGHDGLYGKERAVFIGAAFQQASETGQPVMTGASIVTPELIRGYSIGKDPRNKVVPSNLRDNASALNAAIVAQNRASCLSENEGVIITERGSGLAHLQFTSREYRNNPSGVNSINLTDGDYGWGLKRHECSSSRAGVLRVLPSGMD